MKDEVLLRDPGIAELDDREYEFLSRQFFMHAEKIDKIHQERSALMRYSIVATFGYFGWLFTHPDIAERHSGTLIVSLSIWLVPFGFNLFGAWRNWFFLCAIRKHGEFLDYLLKQGMDCRNHFGDYKAVRRLERVGPHPSVIFWLAILAVSLASGAFGVVTDQVLPVE